jgi:hypothetical protein
VTEGGRREEERERRREGEGKGRKKRKGELYHPAQNECALGTSFGDHFNYIWYSSNDSGTVAYCESVKLSLQACLYITSKFAFIFFRECNSLTSIKCS